jgi:hypothetical protein
VESLTARSQTFLSLARPDAAAGPLLRELLAVQDADDEAVAYPQLQAYASALMRRAEDLDSPLIWPVGQRAERLAGAAVLLSHGRVRVRGWNDDVNGDHVLLVAVAQATPLGLVAAAEHAYAAGASEVHACGVAILGVDRNRLLDAVAGYADLREAANASTRVCAHPVAGTRG